MFYFYLVVSVFMVASASIFGKFFERKNETAKDATKLYNFFQLASIFLIWGILYAFNCSFDVRVLPYCVLFAACFTVCNIGVINALKYGPTTLTALFNSLSLLVTTIWGFIFWNDKITLIVITGLLLVTVSIYLCLYTGKKEEKQFSWKWLFFVLLAFFGNAGCTIAQRTQQMQFNGHHKYMLMSFAMFLSTIACFVIYVLGDKKDSKEILKKSWFLPVTAGACNVVLNLFVMLLATSPLSPSLIYPVIGVGGLMIVTIVSLFIFKEKLRWQQWLGIVVGTIATLLLSI